MAIEGLVDAPAREEALDPSRSFIVEAPAGSGKTELLMQRFLTLLALVDKPEEVLALTFTRKAAGEMQRRVISAIRRAEEGAEPLEPHEAQTLLLAKKALDRDRALGWDLVNNPGRLKVLTIDSLCSSIVRLTPMLSRVGGLLNIAGNPEELYEEAAKRTVLMAEDDGLAGEAVRKALRHLDNSVAALTRRLVIMLGRRDQWLRHIRRGALEEELRAVLEGSLKRLVVHILTEIRATLDGKDLSAIFVAARYASIHMPDEGKINVNIRALVGIKALPEASIEALPVWRGLAGLLLTQKGELRKKVDKNIGFPAEKKKEWLGLKDGLIVFLDEQRGDAPFIDALARITPLPDPVYDNDEWEILDALMLLLPVAEANLAGVFAEEGAVDFQAISMAALDALGAEEVPTDLMLLLDMRLKHILVDEYQDTSATQLGLLKALTRGWTDNDGRTLFVVGDPMQSIYLFREAQVGLFIDAKERGVGDIRLHPLRLQANFRSFEKVVEWVNGAFGPAFPAFDDVFIGAVSYSPSVAVKTGDGEVEVSLYEGRNDGAEAERVVSVIKSIDRSESVAVLCRSRRHLDETIALLKAEGILFRAEAFDPLSERVVVRDLSMLLRALNHPYDRVAWLSILRAPWCGLSLPDMHELCMNDNVSPVFALINDDERLKTLSQEGRERVSRIKDKLSTALPFWGRQAPREVLEGLWIDLGGPACVEDATGMEDAEAFLTLLEEMTVAGTLDPLKKLDERLSRLYAGGGPVEANVDLMTIHKAKGLEFDHVILPGLGRYAKGEDKKLILWMERGDDLLLAPVEKKNGAESPIYDFLKKINREKSVHEEKRVFYVATTRARKRLFISGHMNVDRKVGTLLPDRRSLLSVIDHSVGLDAIVSAEAFEPAAPRRRSLKRLPLSWERTEPAPPLASALEALKVTASPEPEFYWAGEAVKHLGTVVHRYLCEIALASLEGWDDRRIRGESARMVAMLRTLGVPAVEALKIVPRAIGVLSRAITDERGRWLLGRREEGRVEWPVSGVIKGEVVHAVIDRSFVENGVRWVIDYKTGGHEGGELEEFLQNEKERYAPQLERYAALAGAGGGVVKKGIYYPAIGAFIEW
ncbi:MAG: hypothetical protein A2X99_02590 [Deltaproteobacteria bacterium GWB2_55_19]|nr:MAG: hypothetical protein A2X99_02590 [Deltaproteobacteria bacterium GWB2_55_19]